LAVVDLPQIQHVPIGHSAARETTLLGNTPVAVFFAVFESPMALQVHRPPSVAAARRVRQDQGLYPPLVAAARTLPLNGLSSAGRENPRENRASSESQVSRRFAEFSAKLTLTPHGHRSKMARRVMRRDGGTTEEELRAP
jgi:hypothetical protein